MIPSSVITIWLYRLSCLLQVGDLSRKHGSLAGLNNISQSYTDWHLPLFGVYSVVGRSIVIHYDDESGTRWVCANIGYPGPVVTAVARFDFFAEGMDILIMFLLIANQTFYKEAYLESLRFK